MNTLYLLSADVDTELNSFGEKFTTLINAALPWVLGILVSIIALLGVYIGLKFASTKKAEQKVEAKGYIKNFFIGLLLIFIIAVLGTALLSALTFLAGMRVFLP